MLQIDAEHRHNFPSRFEGIVVTFNSIELYCNVVSVHLQVSVYPSLLIVDSKMHQILFLMMATLILVVASPRIVQDEPLNCR